MKGLKLAFAAVCAAAILLPGSSSKAQDTVVFAGAGSSALFLAFGQAAYQTVQANNGATYTSKNGASVVDTSTGSSISTSGKLWIVYGGTAGNYTIYYDVSVDSTVGDRAFFNSDTLSLNTSSLSANGDDLLQANTGIADTPLASVPSEVINAVNNSIINAGMTDITPADALAATLHAQNLGYNSGSNPIKGYTNGDPTQPIKTVPVISFTLSSRAFQLQPVGATPVMVIVNKTDTSSGAFGDPTSDNTGLTGFPLANNVDRFVLANYMAGSSFRTRDLMAYGATRASRNSGGSTIVPDKPVQVFLREIGSGTYTTTEYCIPASKEIGLSQETGVNATTNNPLHLAGKDSASFRTRVIGTGDMLNAVIATPNSLGYAFWAANFPSSNSSLYANTKYLTVDGVDPLQDSYVDGSYPSAADISFKNVKNGSYPIWSILRAVIPSSPSTAMLALFTSVTNLAANTDFVSINNMHVFRSHYLPTGLSGITPHNGNVAFNEAGGDAGGAVFSVNADLDYHKDFGKELVSKKQ